MTAITAPFERIKIVLQIQGQQSSGGKPQYSGGFDALRGIYKQGGLRSGTTQSPFFDLTVVFRGSLATIARDGPGSAAYFAVYEYTKRKLTPEGKQLSLPAVIMAGGLAGILSPISGLIAGVAMWTLVFPVDTIKSALQASATPTTLPATVRMLNARGGIGAFFPGIGPALLRSFPANAATFLGVEIARKGLDTLF
jgi:solute carrier family 25 carnitine/acylcarnitine transporter 20/29